MRARDQKKGGGQPALPSPLLVVSESLDLRPLPASWSSYLLVHGEGVWDGDGQGHAGVEAEGGLRHVQDVQGREPHATLVEPDTARQVGGREVNRSV